MSDEHHAIHVHQAPLRYNSQLEYFIGRVATWSDVGPLFEWGTVTPTATGVSLEIQAKVSDLFAFGTRDILTKLHASTAYAIVFHDGEWNAVPASQAQRHWHHHHGTF